MWLLAAVAVSANVFIGTDGKGNATPAACVPFGMVQAGPDTSPRASEYAYGKEHCSGYQYADRYLWRFSQTHVSGMGVPSNGDIGILPQTEKDAGSRLALLKSTESAHPGFYGVTLTNGVRCEVTATPHTAVYRLTYPKGSRAQLLVDLDWGLKAPDSGREGVFTRTVYGTSLRFDGPDAFRGYRRLKCYYYYAMHFAARA